MTSPTNTFTPEITTNTGTNGDTVMSELVVAGTTCLENGDLPGALVAYEKVVSAFPDRPEGHNNLGALYTSMGEFAKAEDCFNRVMDIIPDNPGIYYNRGMARSNQEKFDLARADFLTALEFNSQDSDVLNNLGVMDFMQGKFKDARIRFQQAMEIQPDYDRALLNLCDVEIAAGNPFQAVTLCENFLKTYNSVEVRRTLLEILSTGCREALNKAGRTAESLLAAGDPDPGLGHKLQQIQKAKAVLEESTTI